MNINSSTAVVAVAHIAPNTKKGIQTQPFGPLADLHVVFTYDDLGVQRSDVNFRDTAYKAFLEKTEAVSPGAFEGVSGLITIASVPGDDHSGAVYWFNEPTRTVSQLVFDRDSDFSMEEFMLLFEAYDLKRFVGTAGIPSGRRPRLGDRMLIEQSQLAYAA